MGFNSFPASKVSSLLSVFSNSSNWKIKTRSYILFYWILLDKRKWNSWKGIDKGENKNFFIFPFEAASLVPSFDICFNAHALKFQYDEQENRTRKLRHPEITERLIFASIEWHRPLPTSPAGNVANKVGQQKIFKYLNQFKGHSGELFRLKSGWTIRYRPTYSTSIPKECRISCNPRDINLLMWFDNETKPLSDMVLSTAPCHFLLAR